MILGDSAPSCCVGILGINSGGGKPMLLELIQ